MLIIVLVIVVLFGALYFVVSTKNKQASEDNPFGKDKLDPATIAQLDDPNYGNQILPEELGEKLANKEDLTVYYYSPKCSFCVNTTPILVPIAEELNIDMKKYNLLEFEKAEIESTPTLIHYENGEEVARVVGQKPEEEFRAFFNEYVVDEEK